MKVSNRRQVSTQVLRIYRPDLPLEVLAQESVAGRQKRLRPTSPEREHQKKLIAVTVAREGGPVRQRRVEVLLICLLKYRMTSSEKERNKTPRKKTNNKTKRTKKSRYFQRTNFHWRSQWAIPLGTTPSTVLIFVLLYSFLHTPPRWS
jgi:hypothetical protein